MPSQAMQDLIDALRDRQERSASQVLPALEELRATFAPGGRLHPVPDDVMVTEVSAGGVAAHWLTAPGTDTGRVLLFLHGGGYELGSLRSDGELAARLGRASGMRVLFPEYRLAPEHPFPAAIDDVMSAWHWLRNDQELSARSLAVAGDSAGGGLTVALLVATRDAGEALPAASVLMSPTVDLTSSGPSMTERADQDPISTPAMLRQFASEYLAGADPKTPLASPLFSLPLRAPAAACAGRHRRPATQRFRTLGRSGNGSWGRRHPRDRRGPAPRLPAHARHPRGSRRHRTDREVPAGPGSLTRSPWTAASGTVTSTKIRRSSTA